MVKKGRKRSAMDDEGDEQLMETTEEPEDVKDPDLLQGHQQVQSEARMQQEQMQPQMTGQDPQQGLTESEALQMASAQQMAESQQMAQEAHQMAQAHQMQNPQLVQHQLDQNEQYHPVSMGGSHGYEQHHMELSEVQPQKKKRRQRVKPKIGDENPNVLIDENGKHIPIPPRHGTPIKHSRPKRPAGPRKTGIEEEPNMLIKVHLRRIEGDPEAAQDTLPSATVHAHPSMTLEALRQKITSLCPSLPARAQHFFKKVDGDNYQRVDSSSRYTKCLKTVGFDEPGPHEIWVEIDLAELFKPGEVTGHPQGSFPEGLTQADLAGVSQAHQIHGVVQDPALMGDGSQGMLDEHTGAIQSVEPPPVTHHRSINKRSNKKWSEEEVEHLLLGLMKYGTSSWTTIAKTWKFEDRTTVDLKDKWRNLVKNVRDGRIMRGMVLTDEARNRVWRIIHENGIEATPQNQRFHTELINPAPQPQMPQMDPMQQQNAMDQQTAMEQQNAMQQQNQEVMTPALQMDGPAN